MFFQGNLGQSVATAMEYKLRFAFLERYMNLLGGILVDHSSRSSLVLRLTPDNVNLVGVSLVSCMSFVMRRGLVHSGSVPFPDSWEDGSS